MKRFIITFKACKKGAVPYLVYTETVDAPDIWTAVSKLYEKYEHIKLVTQQWERP